MGRSHLQIPTQSVRRSTMLSLLLAAVVLLPLLGHRPLTSWDEGIYAEISREMLSGNGGWLTPHWNYQPWFEKPPLMLWITAVFFKLFGVSEFWARAGSAFSGVALVGVLHAWLARHESRLSAWLSSVILLSTFGFLHAARVSEMDVLLSLGCAVALCGLAEVQVRRPAGWYLFWAGFAIALMTKGAASVVLLLTLALLAMLGRWTPGHLGRPFVAGFALFLAAVLPWHLVMFERYGSGFVHEYLGYHVLARATRSIENHPTHWWFYLWVLLVSAPPWVLLFPVAVVKGWKTPRLQPWAVFAVVVVVFFSAVRTRLPHYVAPAYPAFAVVTAVWLAGWLKRHEGVELRSRATKLLAGVVMYGLAAAVTAHPRSLLHSTQQLGAAAPLHADDRELIGLLRTGLRTQPMVAGPLLVWRDGPPTSIATSVFYARRPVQQVGAQTVAKDDARYDRYTNSPVSFADALSGGPRLLLVDRSLVARLPVELRFAAIATSRSFALGIVSGANDRAIAIR